MKTMEVRTMHVTLDELLGGYVSDSTVFIYGI